MCHSHNTKPQSIIVPADKVSEMSGGGNLNPDGQTHITVIVGNQSGE